LQELIVTMEEAEDTQRTQSTEEAEPRLHIEQT
jgi:hypothetical protein